MSDAIFSELKAQVKLLPLYQIAMLKRELEEIMAANDKSSDFVFDTLVCHTDRANHADEYIREFRDNDRS